MGIMGAPDVGGMDSTNIMEAYDSLLLRTGSDPAADDVMATFP